MPMRTNVLSALLLLGCAGGPLLHAQKASFEPVTGTAAYYSHVFDGRHTADHGTFHSSHMTAASSTIPIGTKVRVTNVKNNKSVVVKVTDLYHGKNGRIIDVSKSAARKLGFVHAGTAEVKVEPA